MNVMRPLVIVTAAVWVVAIVLFAVGLLTKPAQAEGQTIRVLVECLGYRQLGRAQIYAPEAGLYEVDLSKACSGET